MAVSDGSKLPKGCERPDLEAAAWLIEHDRGLTAARQDEFLQWLAADPKHQKWYARHRQTWKEFNLLAQWRPEHSADPNPDLLARPRIGRRLVWMWSGSLAAAASLALAWVLRPARVEEPKEKFPVEIVAAAYEHRVLEDGSAVDLNRGARLTVQFTPGERRVALLRGEAQFTVAKNPGRPFIVRAGGVDVRAVGTAFNVRLNAGAVEVLVTEGKVQLDRSPKSPASGEPAGSGGATGVVVAAVSPLPVLIAGQRTVISLKASAPEARVVAATAEDMNRLLAWQPQLLDFNSTPLSDVVAEFNRRNRTQLILADDELRSLPIVASFRSDNLDGFVRLLEVTAAVRVERQGAERIVLRKSR